MFFKSKCEHNWAVLSEVTTKSMFQHSLEVSDSGNLPHQLCNGKRKHILVVTCSKCGSLKRFVEDI